MNIQRVSFEVFTSQMCHILKRKGDIDFIIDELREDTVEMYWDMKWYAEAFYLLAMIDYVSRENELPLCLKYNHIRAHKLSKSVFPKDIIMGSAMSNNLDIRQEYGNTAIPEFLRFNIYERDIRNVT